MAVRDQTIDQPILDSAKKEFLEKGFEKSSLKTICANANVTTGALYKRYAGKEELFEAVVEDTIKDMSDAMEQRIHVDVKNLSDQKLIDSWEMKTDEMMWWFNFLYDHYDGFKLILTCASGTKYEDFEHDWVERMSVESWAYYKEAYKRGLTKKKISERAMHCLLSAYWTTIYEPFIHEMSKPEIEAYCELVCDYIDWQSVFKFQKS